MKQPLAYNPNPSKNTRKDLSSNSVRSNIFLTWTSLLPLLTSLGGGRYASAETAVRATIPAKIIKVLESPVCFTIRWRNGPRAMVPEYAPVPHIPLASANFLRSKRKFKLFVWLVRSGPFYSVALYLNHSPAKLLLFTIERDSRLPRACPALVPLRLLNAKKLPLFCRLLQIWLLLLFNFSVY